MASVHTRNQGPAWSSDDEVYRGDDQLASLFAILPLYKFTPTNPILPPPIPTTFFAVLDPKGMVASLSLPALIGLTAAAVPVPITVLASSFTAVAGLERAPAVAGLEWDALLITDGDPGSTRPTTTSRMLMSLSGRMLPAVAGLCLPAPSV